MSTCPSVDKNRPTFILGTLGSRENGWHFAGNILVLIFVDDMFKTWCKLNWGSHCQYTCIDSCNGLMPHKQQQSFWVLFTKRSDVLQPNVVKSRSRESRCLMIGSLWNYDRHLGSVTAKVPVKFQSDWNSLNLNDAASRLHEILW